MTTNAKTHRPVLFYWAMTTVSDTRNPTGNSTWTLWLGFREPPMDRFDQKNHVGIVSYLAVDEGPHNLMKAGFTFDLFVGPDGVIAKGEILEPPKKKLTSVAADSFRVKRHPTA